MNLLDSRFRGNDENGTKRTFYESINKDDLVKSLLGRLPGESRGPERLEITGFRLEFIPMKIGAGMTEKPVF